MVITLFCRFLKRIFQSYSWLSFLDFRNVFFEAIYLFKLFILEMGTRKAAGRGPAGPMA